MNRVTNHIARQLLIVVLMLWPLYALAKPEARYDRATSAVVITGLDADQRRAALYDPSKLMLQIANTSGKTGMLIRIMQKNDILYVTPHFPLRDGTQYSFSLNLENREPLGLTWETASIDAPRPQIVSLSPQSDVLPANTLRLYLTFTEPMARGQVAKVIKLHKVGEDVVDYAFLGLETELWDASQSRLTLLFDPGRLKQGVGPNQKIGAPLEEGQSYRLIISGTMKSAAGIELGRNISMAFNASAPIRKRIDPSVWIFSEPQSGTKDRLEVQFDRVMDRGTLKRLLAVKTRDGIHMTGKVSVADTTWNFLPDKPWQKIEYQLVVDPALEDVSGNTIPAPFDAPSGTASSSVKTQNVSFFTQ